MEFSSKILMQNWPNQQRKVSVLDQVSSWWIKWGVVGNGTVNRTTSNCAYLPKMNKNPLFYTFILESLIKLLKLPSNNQNKTFIFFDTDTITDLSLPPPTLPCRSRLTGPHLRLILGCSSYLRENKRQKKKTSKCADFCLAFLPSDAPKACTAASLTSEDFGDADMWARYQRQLEVSISSWDGAESRLQAPLPLLHKHPWQFTTGNFRHLLLTA